MVNWRDSPVIHLDVENRFHRAAFTSLEGEHHQYTICRNTEGINVYLKSSTYGNAVKSGPLVFTRTANVRVDTYTDLKI